MAVWAFGAYVAVAGPLLVFHLGSYFWFFRDDWYFITDRQASSVNDLFAGHNSHWVTLPVVIFRALYAVFGIRTYVPYQMVVVALHLGVAVLIRVVMRRAGVGPWIASLAAGSLVLFGPGREDILWAFQMGFTGAVFLGLAQLLLADHDGGFHRRDLLALLAGLLALMSTATGVAIAVVVGLALLIRRGPKVAAIQTAPLALAYGIWAIVEHPESTSVWGRPSVDVMLQWVRSGQIGTFLGLGHYQWLAAALAALTVVGLVLAIMGVGSHESSSTMDRIRAIGVPLAMLAGSVGFTVLAAQARWIVGPQAARASRYLYIGAALTLPALGVAIEAICRIAGERRALLVVPFGALLVLPIPANIGAFDDPPFGPDYHRSRRDLLTTAVRVPYASDVEPDLRPIPDIYLSPNLDMGFLLDAYRNGKLDASSGSIPPGIATELNVRLGLGQSFPTVLPSACTWVTEADDLDAPKGSAYLWDAKQGSLAVRPTNGGDPGPLWIELAPGDGTLITVGRSGVDFDWKPARPGADFKLCEVEGAYP